MCYSLRIYNHKEGLLRKESCHSLFRFLSVSVRFVITFASAFTRFSEAVWLVPVFAIRDEVLNDASAMLTFFIFPLKIRSTYHQTKYILLCLFFKHSINILKSFVCKQHKGFDGFTPCFVTELTWSTGDWNSLEWQFNRILLSESSTMLPVRLYFLQWLVQNNWIHRVLVTIF